MGTEREVSLASGQEIISQLNPEKYEVIDLVFDAPKELIIKLQTAEIEFAYLALHGKFGEDGNIQAILEGLEIPYLGSGVLSSALGMDKDISKRVLKSYDIRTPQGKSIRKGEICHRAEVEKF
ncbi:MAG: hypothetical protein LBO09_05450 [Candidatus Peribacteria bacterium]|nr:hypothetical protein [Candidatus Peribacteria bacterium]